MDSFGHLFSYDIQYLHFAKNSDLTCSICLTIFTDPVSLLCGHSFCKECITISLSKKDQCPQCRTTVPIEEKYLPTSHILKSLADKAKEAEKMKTEQGDETTGVSLIFFVEII
uniref:RING-type domain-containing protein n=1 Tax=Myripristis murdjan TaxID=586833 RepID=A0A667XA80_9TELE